MLTKRKIGVLLGGVSAEREVSIKSGTAVLNGLKRLGYNAVGIDAGADVSAKLREENIGIAFIVLHGGWGENGAVQGLCEVMGIPYTGSGVMASAIGMDKLASKKMFQAAGVPVPSYEVFKEKRPPSMPFPVVVKPRAEGSSIGVDVVDAEADYGKAFDEAFKYGGEVIVEEFIRGKEVQIGVISGRALGGVEVVTTEKFYNFAAKYTKGKTEYFLPPRIDDATMKSAFEIAVSAHKAIGADGATRVDLIVKDRISIYALEVNTIPGMTETSLLPKIAGLAGYSFDALLEEMLMDAMNRFGVKN